MNELDKYKEVKRLLKEVEKAKDNKPLDNFKYHVLRRDEDPIVTNKVELAMEQLAYYVCRMHTCNDRVITEYFMDVFNLGKGQ